MVAGSLVKYSGIVSRSDLWGVIAIKVRSYAKGEDENSDLECEDDVKMW